MRGEPVTNPELSSLMDREIIISRVLAVHFLKSSGQIPQNFDLAQVDFAVVLKYNKKTIGACIGKVVEKDSKYFRLLRLLRILSFHVMPGFEDVAKTPTFAWPYPFDLDRCKAFGMELCNTKGIDQDS